MGPSGYPRYPGNYPGYPGYGPGYPNQQQQQGQVKLPMQPLTCASLLICVAVPSDHPERLQRGLARWNLPSAAGRRTRCTAPRWTSSAWTRFVRLSKLLFYFFATSTSTSCWKSQSQCFQATANTAAILQPRQRTVSARRLEGLPQVPMRQ